MWTTIIIFVLVAIIFNFIKFSKDTSAKKAELQKVGGIKEKYKELISYFDDFDLYKQPTIITNDTNNYEIGWAGNTSIITIRMFEVLENLHVIFTSKMNENEAKNMSQTLSNEQINTIREHINKKYEWKLNTGMRQTEMIEIISNDIQKLLGV